MNCDTHVLASSAKLTVLTPNGVKVEFPLRLTTTSIELQGSVETVGAIVPFSCFSPLHKWWSSVGLISGLESLKALPRHARKTALITRLITSEIGSDMFTANSVVDNTELCCPEIAAYESQRGYTGLALATSPQKRLHGHRHLRILLFHLEFTLHRNTTE